MRKPALALFVLLSSPILAAGIEAPDGFRVEVFARDLGGAHTLFALEDGTVLVSRPKMNDVIALRDRDGDGRADEMRTAIASVDQARGLAMRGRILYVAGVKQILRAERLPDGSFAEPQQVVTDLPDGGQHPERALGVGPDGKLYVAVGSSCSDCTETNPEHGTVLQLDADGGNRRIFARGLRSPRGLDWQPGTGELWAGETGEVHGQINGEINRIGDGLHYGWPLCAQKDAKLCRTTEPAALDLPSRAPGSFVFYRGVQFPEEWRSDAYSIDGKELLRIRFDGEKPAAAESFVRFGAPLTGAAVAGDGSLLVSDDANGIVYRVSYGEALPQAMTSSASEQVTKPVLAKAFGIENLKGPESVVHDEEQDVYFVSNIDGAAGAKDGKGFISRVTPDGRLAELKFIDGLDAPKGMAIRDTELWVADIDKMRVFDRVTGAELATIDMAEDGAVFLRDVAVGPDNHIYVTDTDLRIKGTREQVRQGDGRVFRIAGSSSPEIVMSGEELRSPSGIAWDGTRFLIAQAYGREVLAWNPGTATKAVMRGPGAFDGVVVLPNGAVIVSSRHDDALHVAHAGGELRPLFTRKPTPAGIGFDRKRNRLLIPSTDGDWLEAWTLPPIEPPKTTTSKGDGAVEMAAKQ
ncbi:MAG TPA: PQQ-dependent sugar dehydrogenase [Thermoanaerobaculia bacterium]|nr:PQQ-dependent sugar dehydrogenase [Thermoanaerobaculia bacterium]